MKITTRNRKYRFSHIFKISSILILIFAAIGIAGSICLFMFGMAWIFMAVYDKSTDSTITWGVVMICLGSYLVFMNAFTLSLTALSINKRSAKGTLLLAIFAIISIAPIIGGITLLFNPFDVSGNNTKSKDTNVNEITNGKDQDLSPEELAEKKQMAQQLKVLKSKIDQGNHNLEDEFDFLLAEYRTRFS